jgi:putative DNA primase/helicase
LNIYDKGVLFKGYVVTENKQCLEKFKGRNDFKTFDQVNKLPEFAGIIDDHIVLIDVDAQEEADVLFNIIQGEYINCVVVNTTRGKHFYFMNDDSAFTSNKTHTTLAIGIAADIKLGKRNSYSILKYNDKLREIVQCPDQLDPVPIWLKSITAKPDFSNMEAGDGRNQALFNYILTLQNQGMAIEEIRHTIKIINKYVLKEPLSDNELDVVLRDEAFKKQSFFKGTKFLHDKFAQYMKNNYHIIRNDGNILIYENGVYEYSPRSIEQAMVNEIPSLKDAQRKEVLKHLNLICDDVQSSSTNLIAFRNGVLNLGSGELMAFSPEHVITNKIPWDYNANAYSEVADKTLNRIACDDPEIRSILEECIGATFYRSNTLAGGKAFILTGEGANGKSTFISVLNRILGKDNTCSLDLKKLDDKFSTVMMYKKLSNLGDDISDEFNADVSVFKKIVTGNTIDAQEKGQPKFNFEPYCKLIFSANNIPRMKDKTGAAQRRLLIVPFNAKFSESDADFDPQITWKLERQDSIEYFIKLGIEGLKRVLKNKKFSSSIKVQKELEEYAEKNNPILSFIKDCEDEEIQIVNEPLNEVFQNYQGFCIRNGYTALAKNEFSKQIQRIMNLTTFRTRINKVQTQVFIPINS